MLVIPPTTTVAKLQRALDAERIPNVVGGSGLLASLGLADTVRDWDLVTDADPSAVWSVIAALGLPVRRTGPSGVFRTAMLYTVDAGDHEVDVLVRFALQSGEQCVPIPARAGGLWQGLQMARPEEWVVAYELMGRHEHADILRRWLDNNVGKGDGRDRTRGDL